MTKIILISGKKRSGKDTAAEYLNYQLSAVGKKGKIYSFADPLKQFCINVFGLTHNQCYGTDDDKNSFTKIEWSSLPFSMEEIDSLRILYNIKDAYKQQYLTARQVLELFGTRVCRRMLPDCWAEATLKQINEESPDYAFVADCRFPNELEVFKDRDPLVIRLQRNLYNSNADAEIALDNYDFTKFNNFLTVPNQDWSIEQKNEFVLQKTKDWLGIQ